MIASGTRLSRVCIERQKRRVTPLLHFGLKDRRFVTKLSLFYNAALC